MRDHLDDRLIAAAVAGLELPPPAAEHLGGCLSCRRAVDGLRLDIAARRDALEADAPDWAAQRRAILDRLPRTVPARRRAWWAPALAVAAAVLVGAVGIAVWQLDPGPQDGAAPPQIALERVLAEADALLADDSIPGFEPIDPFPGVDSDSGWSEDMEQILADGAS